MFKAAALGICFIGSAVRSEIIKENAKTTIEKSLLIQQITNIDAYDNLHYQIPYDTIVDNVIIENECPVRNSSFYDFPTDLFTQEQRLQGAIILHIIGFIYFISVTAVIINDYFVPAVAKICNRLRLSPDVAAATFMATATTMPELFTNIVSTFIAKSNMGIGTILGSLMFNTLGTAAVIAIVSKEKVQLDWWQPTRDCFLLAINTSMLVFFSWDGRIFWWEALILIGFIVLYYVIMFQNENIKRFVKKHVEGNWNCCAQNVIDYEKKEVEIYNDTYKRSKSNEQKKDIEKNFEIKAIEEPEYVVPFPEVENLKPEEERKSLWRVPQEKWRRVWWFYTWPIKFVLTAVVPNPKTHPRLYPLTFIICIGVIGLNSYMVIWMLTAIGYTFGIPEAVMGLTFLAIGGCLPEVFTAIVMSLRGQGGMSLSNSLGTNSLSILLSLGLPWFVRAIIDHSNEYPPYIYLSSLGIQYVVLSLLLVVSILFIVLTLYKYRLQTSNGIIFIVAYLVFLTFALLMETGVIIEKVC